MQQIPQRPSDERYAQTNSGEYRFFHFIFHEFGLSLRVFGVCEG
jgi:hypothetical protein